MKKSSLQQYVVFEFTEKSPKPEVLGPSPSEEEGKEVEFEVRNAELSEQEAFEEAKDSRKAVFPNLEYTLVQPFPMSADAVPAAAADGVSTWGLEAIGVPGSQYSGRDVTVAVLDTGIDRNHPAFSGVEIVEKDFTGEGNGDSHGHGTHCAGTVFGREMSGVARFGVAPGIKKALIAKVLGTKGADTVSLVNAIRWAMEEGADVISMSLGTDFPKMIKELVASGLPDDFAASMALQRYRKNVEVMSSVASFGFGLAGVGQSTLIVAASGNESHRNIHPAYTLDVAPPAAAQGILAVGACLPAAGGKMDIASFSNGGPAVVAPGVQILSAWPGGGTRHDHGTSMATPHVAGLAALWFERLREARGQEVSAENVMVSLRGNARDDVFVTGTPSGLYGAGLVTAP